MSIKLITWPYKKPKSGDSYYPSLGTVYENINDSKRALDLIVKKTGGHFYKIGVTGNPVRRSGEHGLVEVDRWEEGDFVFVKMIRGLWDTMHVVYRTSSEIDARAQESTLVEHAKNLGAAPSVGQSSMNHRAGGAGLLRAGGIYYVYLLKGGNKDDVI